MSEDETKESEQKTTKRQKKAFQFAELESAKSLKTKYTGKKSRRNKISKTRKKPIVASSKTKISKKKFICDPKAPKMATTSSSRLKSKLEKIHL